jgi:hypothetical protein
MSEPRVLRQAEETRRAAIWTHEDAQLARAVAAHVMTGWLLGLALGIWAVRWFWREPGMRR